MVAAGLAVPASAQTSSTQSASNDQVETVVVTAERREQNVLEVPLAVQAISPSDIDKLGASSVTDLTKIIPGAALVGSFGPGFETIELRGVAAGQYGDGLVGF
jgi:iron complex outermembrane receptor protein